MKYEFTFNTLSLFGRKLYQIKALKDFGNVNKGDLGGYIEKEGNLSQEGNCWVSGNAQVYGNAKVFGNQRVSSGVISSTIVSPTKTPLEQSVKPSSFTKEVIFEGSSKKAGCAHEFVDVGFMTPKFVCKHCDLEKNS